MVGLNVGTKTREQCASTLYRVTRHTCLSSQRHNTEITLFSILTVHFFIDCPTITTSSSRNMDCPGDRDILCGDVNAFFDHLGNRRFRKLIDLHTEEYISDSTTRDSLVKDIVHALKRSGYRLLEFNDDLVFEEVRDDVEIARTVSSFFHIVLQVFD